VHHRLAGQYCSVTKISGNCPLKSLSIRPRPLAAFLFRASSISTHRTYCAKFTIVPVGSCCSRPSAPATRRLCPLDMNLLQGENSPGTEELPR
jgi:hypothetical protein